MTPVASRDFPAVDGVTAAVYEIPTDLPEGDATLAWTATTLVVAHVSGGGRTGLSYTHATSACKPLIEGKLTTTVTGHSVLDTGAVGESSGLWPLRPEPACPCRRRRSQPARRGPVPGGLSHAVTLKGACDGTYLAIRASRRV
jgi:hypothetical protein